MKKITNKTRVRVSRKHLHDYLNLDKWYYGRLAEVEKYMYDNFAMRYTSKRIGVYYFSIEDKSKYSLFLLKHSDLIRDPHKWY